MTSERETPWCLAQEVERALISWAEMDERRRSYSDFPVIVYANLIVDTIHLEMVAAAISLEKPC